MTVWRVLLPGVLIAVVAAAEPAPPETIGKCCVSETFEHQLDEDATRIRKRFDAYKAIGADMLRIHFFVDDRHPGATHEQVLRGYDFRLKAILCNLPVEEEFQLVDQNGARSKNALDYWRPDARAEVRRRTEYLLEAIKARGLMDRVDFVIPFMGPAGESAYPHPWTTGLPEPTFWCYSPHARRDFRARMSERYGAIAAANAAWGTDFASWDDVQVLKPGEKPGAYWEDVLRWYRQTKRDFMRWSVEMVQELCDRKVILYLPGSHFTAAEWDEAVRTAGGDWRFKCMIDLEFTVDLAKEKGCWLQYTGVENRPEAAYAARLAATRGNGTPIWGENAGYLECAKDPVLLAEILLENGYHGLDFTWGGFGFEEDDVTPNQILSELGRAFRMLREKKPSGSQAGGQ